MSRMRWIGRANSTWCTTISTGCRWLRRPLRGARGHHHPRLLQPGDPAGLPAALRLAYVSISDSDRVPELDYAATIYHGIDLGALPFSADGGEDLVILGRIHPDKGTAEAIDIAARAGRRLIIAGIVAGRRLFPPSWSSRSSTATRSSTLGSVGPPQRASVLGCGPRPAAPDRLRRAVRTVRGRVHGHRHTGHRLPARLDARGRSTRASPASWSTAWPRRPRPSTGSANSIAPAIRRRGGAPLQRRTHGDGLR